MGHEMGMMKRQQFRFLLVGGWNTIFGYMAFIGIDALLTRLVSERYVAYMTAAVISNVLAVINAYVFHRIFTFRSTIQGMGLFAEFIRFSSMYVFTFGLNLLLLPFFVEVLDISPRIAAAMVICCCTLISYIGHSRFSFRNRDSR